MPTDNTSVAVEVRAIGQRTRSGQALLRDVSLDVTHGELVAITGASCSGNTALLDAMSGLRAPSCGAVHRFRGNVGYVPQGDAIHAGLPLARALRYTASLRQIGAPGRADGAVGEVLTVLDLSGRSLVPAGDLSGGERKRASIAAELLATPRLVFLDEPTSGLDPARSAELMRTLRRLCDDGTTVVLTTHNPLDADRCDKIAVLASGGHLAFFGSPAAARDYFGADSLDEIYERLAGLGDPAKAWSRRFFPLSRTASGVSPPPGIPQAGPPVLLPDSAGPLSAGPVTTDLDAADLLDRDVGAAGLDAADLPAAGVGAADVVAGGQGAVEPPVADPGGAGADRASPVRQWRVLTRRNADICVRGKRAWSILAGPPLAVLLLCLVLFRPGTFNSANSGPQSAVLIAFWVAFGAFFFGLTYGLPQICGELGVLRRERFAGLTAGSYVLAKVAVLVPLLAVADALFLVLLRVFGRLPAGGDYPAAFVTLLLSSAAALGLGLLISAAVPEPSRAAIAVPIACFAQVLFAGAILPVPAMALVGRWISYVTTDRWTFEALGHSLGLGVLARNGRSSLLAPYGTTFGRAVAVDWLILAGFTVVFCAATIGVVVRKTRTSAGRVPNLGP
jgi:ABC-type multidrug transport system ATPase subunit/ABC-type multidrug transport system permease subunit